jgi:hypothetical protein
MKTLLLLLLPASSLAGIVGTEYFELHSADSGEQVRRDWLPQEQCRQTGPDKVLSIEAAQNEYEAVQLVVLVPSYVPKDFVHNFTWSVGPLVGPDGAIIPATDLAVVPIGFVAGGPCPFDALSPSCPADKPLRCVLGDAANNTNRCVSAGAESVQCVGCSASPAMINYRRGAYSYSDARRWWPHLLLDHVRTFDVARGTAQPLLFTVRTRTSTVAGVYTAEVVVSADGSEPQRVTLSVTVHNVAIPEAVGVLSLWGTQINEWDLAFSHVRGAPPEPCNDSAFAELLLDHRIPAATSIYQAVWPSYLNQTSALHPHTGSLRELWERGQRTMVIMAFCDCTHIDGFARRGCNYEQRVAAMMETARALKQAGWAESSMYVYLLDETDVHNTTRIVSQRVKQLLPQAKTIVLGDNAFPKPDHSLPLMNMSQLQPGGWLEFVDILIPRISNYANSSAVVRAIQATGRQVGWYSSGVPAGNAGLNVFAEYPPIRPRLLMGTAAWKLGSDAYLYYSINGWVPYSQGAPWDPADVSPTMESRYIRWINASYDGEGQLVSPGPTTSRYGGFLSSLQLEGVRDGLEDLELYRVLSRRVAQARARGIDASSEAAALAVPAALLEGVTPSNDPPARTFSEDPFSLRAQWRAVVGAIESLDGKLQAAKEEKPAATTRGKLPFGRPSRAM